MIVEAVGIATSHGATGEAKTRADILAEAMRQAVIKAQAEGIIDPDVIRQLMLEARDAA